MGRQTPGWFPGWAAKGIAAVAQLASGGRLAAPAPSPEDAELVRKIGLLRLDNDAVSLESRVEFQHVVG